VAHEVDGLFARLLQIDPEQFSLHELSCVDLLFTVEPLAYAMRLIQVRSSLPDTSARLKSIGNFVGHVLASERSTKTHVATVGPAMLALTKIGEEVDCLGVVHAKQAAEAFAAPFSFTATAAIGTAAMGQRYLNDFEPVLHPVRHLVEVPRPTLMTPSAVAPVPAPVPTPLPEPVASVPNRKTERIVSYDALMNDMSMLEEKLTHLKAKPSYVELLPEKVRIKLPKAGQKFESSVYYAMEWMKHYDRNAPQHVYLQNANTLVDFMASAYLTFRQMFKEKEDEFNGFRDRLTRAFDTYTDQSVKHKLSMITPNACVASVFLAFQELGPLMSSLASYIDAEADRRDVMDAKVKAIADAKALKAARASASAVSVMPAATSASEAAASTPLDDARVAVPPPSSSVVPFVPGVAAAVLEGDAEKQEEGPPAKKRRSTSVAGAGSSGGDVFLVMSQAPAKSSATLTRHAVLAHVAATGGTMDAGLIDAHLAATDF
jgi:hypothetical protein